MIVHLFAIVTRPVMALVMVAQVQMLIKVSGAEEKSAARAHAEYPDLSAHFAQKLEHVLWPFLMSPLSLSREDKSIGVPVDGASQELDEVGISTDWHGLGNEDLPANAPCSQKGMRFHHDLQSTLP
jgi:hypothetical protein